VGSGTDGFDVNPHNCGFLHIEPQGRGVQEVSRQTAEVRLVSRKQNGGLVPVLADGIPGSLRRAVRDQRVGGDDVTFIFEFVSGNLGGLPRPGIGTSKDQGRAESRGTSEPDDTCDLSAALVSQFTGRIGSAGFSVLGDAMTKQVDFHVGIKDGGDDGAERRPE
jgi:hypothetical protein